MFEEYNEMSQIIRRLSDTNMLQNILEKFEFFPIKCRVQRSLEIFRNNWDLRMADNQLESPWKQKVCQLACISVQELLDREAYLVRAVVFERVHQYNLLLMF